MSHPLRTDHIGWKLIGIVTMFSALLIVLFRVGTLDAQPSPDYNTSGKVILYFASESTDTDPLLNSRELENRNVTIVSDFSRLRELSDDLPTVGAIIIHDSRIGDLDANWIQDIYAQKIVVAGLNITISDLALVVGDETVAQDPIWTNDWQQEPYFSVLARKLTGTAEEQELAEKEGRFLGIAFRDTDNVIDNDFGLFFQLVDRNIGVLEGEK